MRRTKQTSITRTDVIVELHYNHLHYTNIHILQYDAPLVALSFTIFLYNKKIHSHGDILPSHH